MITKEKHRLTALHYLANPENEFPTRVKLAEEVLGFGNSQSLYAVFTVQELQELEAEALELRRSKYAPSLSRVDTALINSACEGNPASAKLCYQRFEGWSEKREINANVNATIEMEAKIRAEVESDLLGKKMNSEPSSHAERILKKRP